MPEWTNGADCKSVCRGFESRSGLFPHSRPLPPAEPSALTTPTSQPFSHPAIPRRVIAVQDGARLHYAIPLAIQRAGMLDRVYTNWYTRPRSLDSLLSKIVGWRDHATGRKMLDRYNPELDPSKITAFRSMVWHERRGLGKFPSSIAYFAWLSDLFAQRVRQRGWGAANTLFGFVRSIHPDLCRDAQRDGLATVADQMIAPYAVEVAEEELQNAR